MIRFLMLLPRAALNVFTTRDRTLFLRNHFILLKIMLLVIFSENEISVNKILLTLHLIENYALRHFLGKPLLRVHYYYYYYYYLFQFKL